MMKKEADKAGQLCYSCYDHVTFQLFGQTPVEFRREMTRYTESIVDGEVVDCYLCDRKVAYYKDGGKKWKEREL